MIRGTWTKHNIEKSMDGEIHIKRKVTNLYTDGTLIINDEDIDTDNEQIKLAVSYSIGEIKEAFDFICKNKKDAFVNFNRYSNFMCK